MFAPDARHIPSTLRLGDGRQLAYTRSHEPGARRVLFCHGTPGSRLFRPPDPMLPAALDIDLVTVDRPGYGRSTRRPHRSLLDWPDDVGAIADHLGWDRFGVIGISGGGPHALACALRLPERVTAVGLVSSVAPFWPDALRGMLATTRRGFQLAHLAPWLLILAARRMAGNPEGFLSRLSRELPDPDRRILARPDVAAVVAENAGEALVSDEVAHEMVLLRRDWGFTPADIAAPVVLWHGEADRNVPVAHGRRLAAALPACRATFVPGAGHYLIFDRWPQVLSSTAEAD
jgi:pimeloyl-ACP methyl ester carboxylesterase